MLGQYRMITFCGIGNVCMCVSGSSGNSCKLIYVSPQREILHVLTERLGMSHLGLLFELVTHELEET